ncbi:hypothetical protein CFC21_034869, partial [Triticum aestivum]
TADLHQQNREDLGKAAADPGPHRCLPQGHRSKPQEACCCWTVCTYGFPNLKNVKELIYKKGREYLDKEPFPLTSNDLIEK